MSVPRGSAEIPKVTDDDNNMDPPVVEAPVAEDAKASVGGEEEKTQEESRKSSGPAESNRNSQASRVSGESEGGESGRASSEAEGRIGASGEYDADEGVNEEEEEAAEVPGRPPPTSEEPRRASGRLPSGEDVDDDNLAEGELREGDDEDEEEEDEEEEDDDEEEEGDDEEEEGDEDEEEDEDESAEDEEALEDIEARMKKKQQLIERYIEMKKDYKFLNKKNSYLQDKLYKISVRKGFIVESKGEEENDKTKKKKTRKISIKHSEEEDPEDMDMDEDEAQADGDKNERYESIAGPEPRDTQGGLKSFMEAALESKYGKIVKRIWKSEESKMNDAVNHELNLDKFREKRDKWEKIHQEKFLDFMDRVRAASDTATDSNTGDHIHRWDTEQYVEEVSKIHTKLCKSLVKMYQNRHGLEFALKRLEETEVQGEGLQMLEYEQLQAENYSLKEKLEDRQKDVENIKGKIAHAVQILAHFRECMHRLTERMEDGNTKLSLINKRVYQVREITDVVTQRYEIFKEEEKNLISVSGLLDNTKLLRDFEKTHFDVLDLKEEKRRLLKLLQNKSREIEEIQAKIRDIQLNLPMLKELAKKRKTESKEDPTTEKRDICQSESQATQEESKEDKQIKLDHLQYLLEKRNLYPTKLKDKIGYVKLPAIAEKYQCHFQI